MKQVNNHEQWRSRMQMQRLEEEVPHSPRFFNVVSQLVFTTWSWAQSILGAPRCQHVKQYTYYSVPVPIFSQRNPDCCHSCSEDAWRGTSEVSSHSSSELLCEKCGFFFYWYTDCMQSGWLLKVKDGFICENQRKTEREHHFNVTDGKVRMNTPENMSMPWGCLLSLDSFHVWGIDSASRQTKIIIIIKKNKTKHPCQLMVMEELTQGYRFLSHWTNNSPSVSGEDL